MSSPQYDNDNYPRGVEYSQQEIFAILPGSKM